MELHRITPLFDAPAIAARIREIARQIEQDYAGETLVAIIVMKGSLMFAADLLRAMPEQDVIVEYLGVTSYAGTESTGTVRITHDLASDISGKHVLLVEDIVDTGRTLSYLLENLRSRRPASLKMVTLLDKPSRRTVVLDPDYSGFVIPDHFVVGFGLDLDQRYRNLPFIGVYDPS